MSYQVLPYSQYFNDEVLRLHASSDWVHAHIDWRTPEAWLEDPTTYAWVARMGERIVGLLAASPAYNGASWLRLVVVAKGQRIPVMLDALWLHVRRALAASDARELGVLAVNDWLEPYLPGLGFKPLTEVVTLMREGPYLPPPLRADLTLSPARLDDLEAVRQVDNQAFEPIWQYTTRDLRDAHGVASPSRFTVARMNRRIVGYQLSTVHREKAAHLVRLATLPRLQGMGVGGMLLGEMVEYFLKRKVKQITVNTQADNQSSLKLYRRFGFVETGYRVRVWHITL